MAPRKAYGTRKNLAHNTDISYENLTIEKVLCPICRSILIEPVSLPCNHVYCASCFQNTIENANLVCPLCRLRIGSWLRSATKTNSLVNVKYWIAIKKTFPTEIQDKLDGKDDNLETDIPIICISNPGEIRQEYEAERKKEEQNLKMEREMEALASQALIEKIEEEEAHRQILEAEKIKNDELMAKSLANEFQKTISASQSNNKKDNKSNKIGPLDKFLLSNKNPDVGFTNFANKEYTCRILCQDINENSHFHSSTKFVAKKIQQIQKINEAENNRDSSDCIESEYRYFKPIDFRHNPPSKCVSPIKVPTKKAIKYNNNKISPPRGKVSFKTNGSHSAFAKVLLEIETIDSTRTSQPQPPEKRKATAETSSRKRSKTDSNVTKINGTKVKTHNHIVSPVFGNSKEWTSPRFNYKNDVLSEKERLKIQEKADFEFAKRLQYELDHASYLTRSSGPRKNVAVKRRKQQTLDRLLTSAKT